MRTLSSGRSRWGVCRTKDVCFGGGGWGGAGEILADKFVIILNKCDLLPAETRDADVAKVRAPGLCTQGRAVGAMAMCRIDLASGGCSVAGSQARSSLPLPPPLRALLSVLVSVLVPGDEDTAEAARAHQTGECPHARGRSAVRQRAPRTGEACHAASLATEHGWQRGAHSAMPEGLSPP